MRLPGKEDPSLSDQRQVVTDLERKSALLKTINDFALKLLSTQTRSELVWYVAREVVGKLGFDDCVIYLVTPSKDTLRQVAAIGVKNPQGDLIINALEIPIGQGITGNVALSKQAIIVDDLSADERYIPDIEPALSEICVPLMIDEEVVGVIDCEDPRPGHFGAEHLETLSTIAAMSSARLKIIDETRRAEMRSLELRALNEQLQDEVVERQKAQEKLRESEDRLRVITEACPVPLIITRRADGTILYANPIAGPAFGLDTERLVGRSVAEFFADPSEREERLRVFDRQGFAPDEEVAMRRADGAPIWTIHSLQAIEFQGEKAILGGFLDITERKRLEERLRQVQKMEAIGQLTGGVAHDFNNLLAVIIGNLDIIDDSLADDSTLRRLVEPALRSARRGATLTERLLAFSRRQALAPEPLDLAGLIRSMDDLLRQSLGELIEMELVTAADVPLCEADRSQLESAILNLAINARDAMPDGGRLTIETAGVRIGPGDAEREQDLDPGAYVMLAVTDSGSGIPRENLKQIFDPFFTTKQAAKGSGLGLSMVYGFAKQSGGQVTVESEPGQGTTFRIYLPVAATQTEKRETIVPVVRGPSAQPETLLIAEDDPDVRTLTVGLLEGAGYRVIGAGSGSEALAKLESEPDVDLLLTDVMMPGGMTGPELAEEVQRRDPGVIVLFMSGYPKSSIARYDRMDGDALLLHKPFGKRELLLKVRQALDRQNGKRAKPPGSDEV